ncbi:MAG: hypothetical protein ACD_28C00403G0007 [uncultured bacterium]|nr:MAG: hypothetical protein ACD_28C00403G0007 [uncultured bacterium]
MTDSDESTQTIPSAEPIPPVSPDAPFVPSGQISPISGLPDNILFYCKDCHELVAVKRVGRQYVYLCVLCGTKNVAFGTLKSLTNFFHLDKKKEEKVRK